MTLAPTLTNRAATPRRRPGVGGFSTTSAVLLLIAIYLVATSGLTDFLQVTVNGLTSGVLIALAAVGVSLVYGVMKMINIAQGDFLAVGAFGGIAVSSGLDLPLWVAVIAGTASGALLGAISEYVVWRPLRRQGAGFYQMLLMSLGLAFVLRYGLVLIASNKPQSLDVDVTATFRLFGIYVGRTQIYVVIIGTVILLALAVALKRTSLGKKTRALSDDFDLAETSGIDANRIVLITWVLAGGLTGLAGVLYTASAGQVTPYVGSTLLLALFAAVILGGLGNPYGAVIGGVVIGVVQEWSTLVVDAQWKIAIGFVALVVALILKPEGILSRPERKG